MAATPEVYKRTPVKATAGFSGMATQHVYVHIVSLAHNTEPMQLDARCQLALNRHNLHCCYAWLVLRVLLIPLMYYIRTGTSAWLGT